MERTVSIHAMNSVLTRRVTDSTGVVCIVVEKINVIQVHTLIQCYVSWQHTKILIMIAAFYHFTIHLVEKKISKKY